MGLYESIEKYVYWPIHEYVGKSFKSFNIYWQTTCFRSLVGQSSSLCTENKQFKISFESVSWFQIHCRRSVKPLDFRCNNGPWWHWFFYLGKSEQF